MGRNVSDNEARKWIHIAAAAHIAGIPVRRLKYSLRQLEKANGKPALRQWGRGSHTWVSTVALRRLLDYDPVDELREDLDALAEKVEDHDLRLEMLKTALHNRRPAGP
jgi:molybdenum-dependent DNA-binding transcriptional regulator ModE